ncbi:MAG: cytochrome-c oxidase, cbb3-type subunit II, partial [Bdellovibrionales bacterium]|nr:cytochrome-c oxidase, cbb3-type subunit II [Bdellovibrionales bacterium]
LLHTALPNWTQTLGMIFSVMLWAPSWGGMINGLLTLRGCWDRLRTEPILKFLALGVTFYGMSTFEGPMMSIKSVNALAHYTDWIIAHVHAGALGWNGLITFGTLYYLVPKLWRTELYSVKLANWHFWLATVGILLYVFAIYTAGLTQGLMLRAVDPSGQLTYPDFVETAMRNVPLYWVRAFAGLVFLTGHVLMIYNVWKTIAGAKAVGDESAKVVSTLISREDLDKQPVHRILEGMPGVFTALTALAVIVASVFSLVPSFLQPAFYETLPAVRPYSALELAGRDIYVKEGCYVCHSQMIRTLPGDVLRYGEASKMEESIYDHPFQWGSKRTGPDLARVGKKYPDLWHYRHMMDPREVTPRSLMPSYPWLARNRLDFTRIPGKLEAMRTLGVPYSGYQVENSAEDAQAQAMAIASGLRAQGAPTGLEDREIVALIAYLQSLGQMKAGSR